MKKQNGNWLKTGLLIAWAMAAWLHLQMAAATTRTVSNLNDTGTNSLREAIAASISGDTIDFSVSGTLTLTGGELGIGRSLTIIGPAAGLIVSGNHASRVFNNSASGVSISGLTITGGERGLERGGGIYNTGTLTVNNCTVGGNRGVGGGGIYNVGTLTFNKCLISGNEAISSTEAAGAWVFNDGTLAVNNCTFFGNISLGSGGGIYNQGTLTVINSTLSGNSFGSTYGTGGGISQSGNSGSTSILNTLIFGNDAPGGGPDVYGSFITLGHNLIGKTDGSSGWVSSDLQGTINAPLNPLLGPLQGNGGTTLTMALLSPSAAIDAGDDDVTSPLFNITTDQRGRPRKSGAHVDIGAYEVGPPPIVTNTNDNGIGSLRDAILAAAPGDPINFAPSVAGTITLTNGELAFGKNLNINGPGTKVLTISGNNVSRIFHITAGVSAISNLRIANGHASGGGGGIAMEGSSLTLNNCAIANCYAQGVDIVSQGGGAIAVVGQANLTIIASTLSSNTTPNAGGGLYLFNAPTVSLINSTVSGNRTLDGELGDGGGGIFVGNGSKLNVTNSTIANNSSVVQGGGLYKGLSGTVTLRNSVVAGNSAGGLGPDCKGTFVSSGYNLIGNSSGSTGFGSTGDQLNVNAQIGSLADNGGPTLTHALLPGSPATDKGSSPGQATDQRGRSRPFDSPSVANASGGDGSDIGAFELNPPVLSIARAANNVVLSWPVYDTGYTLEAKTDLNPIVIWSNVAGTPAIVAGQFTVTNSATPGNKFYRLKSQ